MQLRPFRDVHSPRRCSTSVFTLAPAGLFVADAPRIVSSPVNSSGGDWVPDILRVDILRCFDVRVRVQVMRGLRITMTAAGMTRALTSFGEPDIALQVRYCVYSPRSGEITAT